jgi:2-amino-4-hydroxy-6-hydroxymethyldihydropteridine diphosphokinase
MESKVYISAGSNVGDRYAFLAKAVENLKQHDMIKLDRISSFYETLPYGNFNQNNFINLVLSLRTTLVPKELFDYLKIIEKKIGRTESEKWGPREIDLDILLFDDLIYKDDVLTIPHPELLKRDFVVEPLLEIEPEITHPVEQKKIKDLLYLLESKTIVNKKVKTIFESTELKNE